MSRPDPTASAALSAQVIKPVFLAFLDFENEPQRVNTSGETLNVSGSGVSDLDGVFDGITADLVDVGEIKVSEGGNESVDITLSGLIGLDNDMLNEIGDPAHWQGRTARFWRVIRNSANVPQGGFQHYYTGYMNSVRITAGPETQTIALTVEGYISAHSAASNRSYLDQERYDSGDLSARAAIAIANGTTGNTLISNTAVPGFGGAAGLDRAPLNMDLR